MKFYHGTTEENWVKIKKEGILWGYRGEGKYRCTYLTPDLNVARGYGSEEVILEVEYNPIGRTVDTYEFNPSYTDYCWEFCVFGPIDIDNVKRTKKHLISESYML